MTVILKADILNETGFGGMTYVSKDCDYGERAYSLRHTQPKYAHALDLLEQAKAAYGLTKRESDTVLIRILAELQYEMHVSIGLFKNGAEQYYSSTWCETLKGAITGLQRTLEFV